MLLRLPWCTVILARAGLTKQFQVQYFCFFGAEAAQRLGSASTAGLMSKNLLVMDV